MTITTRRWLCLAALAFLLGLGVGAHSVDRQPPGWRCTGFDTGVDCVKTSMVWSVSDGAIGSRHRRLR